MFHLAIKYRIDLFFFKLRSFRIVLHAEQLRLEELRGTGSPPPAPEELVSRPAARFIASNVENRREKNARPRRDFAVTRWTG